MAIFSSYVKLPQGTSTAMKKGTDEDWRYLSDARPMFQGYVREYVHKIWTHMVQYLHSRILNFPLMTVKIHHV